MHRPVVARQLQFNFSRLYAIWASANVKVKQIPTSMTSSKCQQNKLVVYRRRMGFTQDQVSQLLGHRSRAMLSKYEHGHSLPPLVTAISLEIILRTPVAFLFPEMHDDLKRRIRQAEEQLAGPHQQPMF